MSAFRDVVGILLREYDTDLERNLRAIETNRTVISGEDQEEQLRIVLELLINFQMPGSLAVRCSHDMKSKGLLQDIKRLQNAYTARTALAGVRFGEKKAALVSKAFRDIDHAGSVKRWLEQVRTGHTLIGKGAPKVRSNLLKQTGYLDEAPVDVHVERFVRRVVGVHLTCDRRGERELKALCSTHLNGLRYREYDLGTSVGVLDKLIRIHCSPDKDEYGISYSDICGVTPRCEVCPARGPCPKVD
ncbi:hypothetical protein EV699_109149 [Plasticicumulans lactativorans]|uniref:Endonuclease-3 n=1 Tax=Plasticicumulans lactativorans TaxID=1133106 RepID=A0A4R2L424_9GAMM|nr:hypothetical protein EV699_109149 [Plasticicumulans lactativorans]